jgi:hypothetical protein
LQWTSYTSGDFLHSPRIILYSNVALKFICFILCSKACEFEYQSKHSCSYISPSVICIFYVQY